MAAISSTSTLREQWRVPGLLWAAVEAEVFREAAENGAQVPAWVAAEIATAAAAKPSLTITASGGDNHGAGWRQGRFPGLRDKVTNTHLVWDRLAATICRYEKAADRFRIAALSHPQTREDLLRACVYRWAPFFGADCALDRVYRDDAGRLAGDIAYAGLSYDADHCPDELMRQVLDMTLLDLLELLDALRTTWPAMFEAVWRRDALTVEKLLLANRALPPMNFLRARKDCREKFRAVVGIFWEAERLFDLLHALGGRSRVTVTRLMSALLSTTSLGQQVAMDSRTARYVATMWCHRAPLAQLFDDGLAIDHDPRHPHQALGPGGEPGIMDGLAGSLTEIARETAIFNTLSAAPFVRDSRLRDVAGEPPVHFFAGRDVRTMAVHFLLEVREWLGSSKGRKANQTPPMFEIDSDSAIGRVALIITSDQCPQTGRAVLDEVGVSLPAGKRRLLPLRPSDLVANPRAWELLYGDGKKAWSDAARRSAALGGLALAEMVRIVRDEKVTFIKNETTTIGHTICFRPEAWFEPYGELNELIQAWKKVGPRHKIAFPGCFNTGLSGGVVAFCGRVAGRLQPAATDMMQDPHHRKPDWLRSSKRVGRPRKNAKSVQASHRPLSAAERCMLARFEASRNGGLLNQSIH